MAHGIQVQRAAHSCVLLSCQLLQYGLSIIFIGSSIYRWDSGILGFLYFYRYMHIVIHIYCNN